jgi:hypothetical protein
VAILGSGPRTRFAARGSHPADQAAGDGGTLDSIKTEVVQDGVDAEPSHGG